MEQGVKVYSGRVLKRSHNDETAHSGGDGQWIGSVNASELSASEQHELIIAEAHRKADEIQKQRFAEIEAEFERRLASEITLATRDLNLGLQAAAKDMAEIVSASVERIIGEMPDENVLHGVIEQAIARHNADRDAQIHVAPEDHAKLEIIRLGARDRGAISWVSLVKDPSLGKGRCILHVGGKRFDVSLSSQIEALRKAAMGASVPDENHAGASVTSLSEVL